MKHDDIKWQSIRDKFPIENGVTYLNNGSFGPCPQPVIDAAITYFRTLETNPQRYLGEYRTLVEEEKELLADFIGVGSSEIVFITNVTVGMNMIANGLRGLAAGDRIVTTDQEYGAVRNVWDYIAQKRGLEIRTVELPTPPDAPDDLAQRILDACDGRTKLITMSHITSPSGMLLPVKAICREASARGILTAIDGAHAPGMIPLDIHDIGCDFYTGNCHKWLCAPKGSGFLYARTDRQDLLDPLIVGWGWKQGAESFIGNFENPGTHNPAMYLGTGAAIRFQQSIGIETIHERGFELSSYFRSRMTSIPGLRPLTADTPDLAASLTAIELARHTPETLHQRFAEERIVVAGLASEEAMRIRISTHIYNTTEQLDHLIGVLEDTVDN